MEPIFANSFNENAFDPNHQSIGSRTLTPEGALTPGPLIYQSIGVEPVINCRGTITAIGGSSELPEVRKAMDSAAQYYVRLDELAMAVGLGKDLIGSSVRRVCFP